MAIRHNKFDFTEFSRKSGHSSPVYSGLFRIAGISKKRKTRELNIWSIASFALAGIGLVLVLQSLSYLSAANNASTEILGAATSAYSQLSDAGDNLLNQNFHSAKGLFVSAQNNIRLAQEKLSCFALLRFLAPRAQSADHLLSGASNLAQAGDKLSQALALFEEFKISSEGAATEGMMEKISANRELLSQAKKLVDRASLQFNSVDAVPADYQDTLKAGKQQVKQLSSLLGQLIGLEDLYLGFCAAGPHTYLVVFQNYDEARATGGFIGTYGVLKITSGKINSFKISSVYDLDGQIIERIAAPGPFQPAIKNWGMRDANWFADFPTSASKLLHLFELGGETADGLIAATPQTFEQLLGLTGPIEMSQYNVTLTRENFQQTVQFQTSVDYDRALNQPKKFLADFAPVFLNRLSNLGQAQWLDLFQTLQNNLNQKQILLYSKTAPLQNRIESLGFAGKISQTEFDYLAIVNSNLGGTKTDLSVSQSANLASKILSDGSVLNTLTIDRDNRALENNKDFLRVLVPSGSQLVSAQGFDPYDFYRSESEGMKTDPDLAAWDQGKMNSDVFVRSESGKTEFSGWLETKAGERRSITLVYILPFKVNRVYSLLLQKQGGSKPFDFSQTVNASSKTIEWISDDSVKFINGVLFKSASASDDFWGMVIK